MMEVATQNPVPADQKAPKQRKFFKTTYTVVILTEDKPFEGDLEDIMEAVNDGDTMDVRWSTVNEEIDRKELGSRVHPMDLEDWEMNSDGTDWEDEPGDGVT